ncbi:MAG: hypothetical protein GY820_28775 [Gammaproteobacteria bacterium]|nr:hypothetical protein [Gammaproteobacteria bacterium]
METFKEVYELLTRVKGKKYKFLKQDFCRRLKDLGKEKEEAEVRKSSLAELAILAFKIFERDVAKLGDFRPDGW